MGELLLGGKPIGEIKGILFDKDGTLINSENRLLFLARSRIQESIKLFKKQNYLTDDISNLTNLLSKAYGLTPVGISPNGAIAVASKADNIITTATVFCILGKSWPNALNDANNVFKESAYKYMAFQNNLPEEKLLPGLSTFLKNCKQRGIKMAILSNDSREGIKQFLKNNKIEDHFPIFLSSEDYPSKPHPGAVRKLCKLMKLSPSECAFIGDADTDMRMACNSEIFLAIGYTAGWEKTPFIYEHHHLITHWNELTFQ